MWPLEAGARAQLDVETPFGDSVFHAIQSLFPRDEDQRSLKLQATTLAMSLGLHRVLVAAQASSSTPRLLLLAVGLWLGGHLPLFRVTGAPERNDDVRIG